MNAVPKPKQGQRSWTDAQRAAQAAKLHARKIWLYSTGPKTPEGKAASSRNARLPDYEQRQAERAEMVKILAYLRTQKSYIDLLKFFHKQEDNLSPHRYYAIEYQLCFLENELIDIERQMFGGLRFHEVIGLENRMDNRNIIPFPSPPPSKESQK